MKLDVADGIIFAGLGLLVAAAALVSLALALATAGVGLIVTGLIMARRG